MKNMENDMCDVKTVLTKLAEKPGKRWDSIVEKILLGIVAALVAFVVARLGL